MQRALILTLFLVVLSSSAMALPYVRIADIIGNPSHYHDMRVKVEGEITKVEPDPMLPNGSIYVLQDSSDQAIRVRSLAPPRLGSNVFVVGTVSQDDAVSKPYLVETAHGEPGLSVQILLAAGGLLVAMALSLIYYVARNPKPTKRRAIPEEAVVPLRRKPVVTQVFRDDPVAALVASEGPHKGEVFKLYPGSNTIGRDDNQTVQLSDDSTVSRSQARVSANNGKLIITNESETNPTKVGGQDVQESEIRDGDIVQVGSTKLRVTVLSAGKAPSRDDRND